MTEAKRTKTSYHNTDFFARLRDMLRAKGNGSLFCFHWYRWFVPAFLSSVLTVTLLVCPTLAFASENCESALYFSGNGIGFSHKTLTSVTFAFGIFTGNAIGNGVTCEVKWSLEYATSESGPWSPVPGGSGSVPGSETIEHVEDGGEVTGLEPETPYYVRGTLTNKRTSTQSGVVSVETVPLAPEPFGGAEATSVAETSIHLVGQVYSAPFETKWRFEYSTSSGGPWTHVPGGEGIISQAEAEAHQGPVGGTRYNVEAELTGLIPDSLYFFRITAEDEPEWPKGSGERRHKETIGLGSRSAETLGPPSAGTFSTHAVHNESIRVLGSVMPHGFDTHYHFEYGSTEDYGSTTPELDAGSAADTPMIVGADLAGVKFGETYHYRLVATNTAVGDPVVHGEDRTLTVPVPAAIASTSSCPNEAFRTGLSASLPDCRAYEQITPVDKEGAVELLLPYGSQQITGDGIALGEDGNHLALEERLVHWGSGAHDGQSPYFFSRTSFGWQMTSGAPQPQAGINNYTPEIFSPTLTSFAFAAAWQNSPRVEFEAGVPGGPYVTGASVPSGDIGGGQGGADGWVAASEDFSKLILKAHDDTLVPGHSTGTASGADLYEYVHGELRQSNVTGSSPGVTIGSCGASMSKGNGESSYTRSTATRHAVSTDGSRVFFEAVPSSVCSEPTHLYMRVDGTETVDIGAYRFVAANGQGTKVLLERHRPGTQELLLYSTDNATTTHLLSLTEPLSGEEQLDVNTSADLSVIYLISSIQMTPDAPPLSAAFSAKNLYRYDVGTHTLRFLVQASEPLSVAGYGASPDGRFDYFLAREVGGLPTATSPFGIVQEQLYRYDYAEGVVECVSCASPFDPEPRLPVANGNSQGGGQFASLDGTPTLTMVSADGSRALFDTASALVPQDVNGEIPPERASPEYPSDQWSPSSDVYEWRRDGTDGCTHLAGCIGLISSGTDGYFVDLLGTAEEGRDVFFSTRSQLTSQDTDSALDIYDARIGGGFPPPPARQVECEGDACSTPFNPPSDLTPSSITFQGGGNPLAKTLPALKGKSRKVKAKKKKRVKPMKRKTNIKRTVHDRNRGVK